MKHIKILANIIFILVIGIMFSGFFPLHKYHLATEEQSEETKLFNPPTKGKAGIYIYRDSMFGAIISRALFIDNELIGLSSSYMFFYREVEGDKVHMFSTQTQTSYSDIFLKTEKDKLYFIKQEFLSGDTILRVVNEIEAKERIQQPFMELGLGY